MELPSTNVEDFQIDVEADQPPQLHLEVGVRRQVRMQRELLAVALDHDHAFVHVDEIVAPFLADRDLFVGFLRPEGDLSQCLESSLP